MPLLLRADARQAPARGLAAWRIATWLLLMFAAFGIVQYVNHGNAVWQALHAPAADPAKASDLYRMLAWDAVYLLAALAVVLWSAGAILRQGWARPGLRFLAVLLALWTAISAGLLFDAMRPLFPEGTDLPTMLVGLPRSYQMALAMKVLAVPLLLWLAWQLGRPAVRAQFRRRR